MIIGNRAFDLEQNTYLMGILNVTPDSFSDGGKWNSLEAAKEHTADMIRQGADIIDIGGESTRPGYTMLSDEEEIQRVVPAIRMVKEHFDIPVSVDTYKSAVAQAAIEAGADMVNDIWGLKYDDKLAGVIAGAKVPCCLMHNRNQADYGNFMEEFLEDLTETLKIAEDAGIPKEQIILDPGVGFGKTYEQNLEVIRCLDQMRKLGCPVLLGTSRKSVVGLTLDLPADQRLEGTLATTVMGVERGASVIRVHDIRENARVIRMTRAILRGKA